MVSKPVFKDLIPTDSQQFDAFFEIYSQSIEKSEQKPKDKIQAICHRKDYLIRLLYSESSVAGFTLSYVNASKRFALLEYMAVHQSKRSHGFGSELLKDLTTSLFEKQIEWLVLEVDSPYQNSKDKDSRVRRVNFYKKNSCREVESFDYILPLPQAPADLGMKLMLYDLRGRDSDSVSTVKLREMVQEMYVVVYGCEAEDARLEKMFSNLPKSLNLKK
ncbi:MAG: GNAT family N-acetyltransferase [Bdellovibrionales bacterium]|nr:GNAT family N-acetyltransferase [Bdellovibrionales bacterium]